MKKIFAKLKFAFGVIFNFYEAAAWSTWRSHIPGALQDAWLDISKMTREEIMRKARFFEKNRAIPRRIGSIFCDFTVGSGGMVFTPASIDAEWNMRAKAYWEKTAAVIDLNSRQTFGSLQQLIAWRDLFDGDIFIIKTRGQDRTGKWWPRIQIIEAHLCSTPPQHVAREGKSVIDGVEVDENGRPTGYWFKTGSDSEQWRLVESKNVIPVFDPERARQTRGISSFAAALNYLHQLDDLQALEFRAVTDSAEKSTFIKTASGEIPPAMVRPDAGNFHEDASAPQAGVDYERRSQQLQESIGGRLQALKTGEDVVQFQPQRPTEATRQLWSYLTSCIFAAVGFHKMLGFSEWVDKAQGTMVRGDYDIAAQTFKARSAVYAAAFREVVIYVLSWGIATDKGLADPPADWTNITWTSPRAVNVDIGRNSAAKINELKAGLTTHESEFASLGLNARDEVTKQIRFVAFVKRQCAEISKAEGVEVRPEEILGEVLTAAQPKPAAPQPDPEFQDA